MPKNIAPLIRIMLICIGVPLGLAFWFIVKVWTKQPSAGGLLFVFMVSVVLAIMIAAVGSQKLRNGHIDNPLKRDD